MIAPETLADEQEQPEPEPKEWYEEDPEEGRESWLLNNYEQILEDRAAMDAWFES